MFIDASAIVALLSGEKQAGRIGAALEKAAFCVTSPIAVLEVALALARPDKFNVTVEAVEPLIVEFLDERDIEIRDLPPAIDFTRLTLAAAHRYRSGRHGLNLGDCLHYACAKYHRLPMLTTDAHFGVTDLDIVN